MTVKGPYTHTGNGYFGAWLAVLMSWLLAFDFMPSLKGQADAFFRGGVDLIGALMFASFAVMLQTLWNLGHHGNGVWILICSGVSFVICLVLHRKRDDSQLRDKFPYIVLFLLAWWTAGFIVATFDSPYVTTGHGFVGCWIAIVTAVMLFDTAWNIDVASEVRKVPIELLGLTLGSAVVLVASTLGKDLHDFWHWWAAICSGTSLAVAIVLLVALSGKLGNRIDARMETLSTFLLIWWMVGAGFMTFKAPFVVTSNGYFGAWIALVSSILMSQKYSSKLAVFWGQATEHGTGLAVLLVASITLFVKALLDAMDHGLKNNLDWALVGSILSLLVCVLVFRCLRGLPQGFKWVALGLTLLWGALVAWLPFSGPYPHTGNGYFACWVGLFACLYLIFHAFGLVGNHNNEAASSPPPPPAAPPPPPPQETTTVGGGGGGIMATVFGSRA